MLASKHVAMMGRTSLLEDQCQCTCQRFAMSFHHTNLLHIKHFYASQCWQCTCIPRETLLCSSYIIVRCCLWSTILTVWLVNYCNILLSMILQVVKQCAVVWLQYWCSVPLNLLINKTFYLPTYQHGTANVFQPTKKKPAMPNSVIDWLW